MRPLKYKEVKKIMDTLLNQTVYSEFITDPSIAYTNARTNEFCGTIYRVYVNNQDSELAEYLYLHECGHIIFGHAKNMDLRMDRFLQVKISAAYAKISRYFPKYDEYLKIFRTAIFNIVMDFEVNSRLFNEDEWKFMNKRVGKLLGQKGVKGLWPQDYGYAPELTWNEYLNLILMDPEKFMKQFKDFLEENDKEEETEEPVELGGDILSEKGLSKLSEIANEHGKGSFEVKDRAGTRKKHLVGSRSYKSAELYTDMNSLLQDISKVLDYKVPRPGHNDILYNYNRHKYNTNVIIPKRTCREVYEPSKLFILLDVSGSINENLVYSLITTFRKLSDKYSKTVFVTWNTSLQGEWNIKEENSIKGGGGTDIAGGIEYITSKYKPSNKDVFFVMSDFVDNLDNWKKELTKMRARKYAVNWNSWYVPENPGFKKVFVYRGK